jgi:hypothetical protein
MSLARVWRRQLYGASSAALIVPCAMLASLVVLALGGGFSQVGVLGQIFAGPPAPLAGGGADAGARAGSGSRAAASPIPAIPAVAARALGVRPGTGGRRRGGPHGPAGAIPRPGAALVPAGGATPIVTQGVGAGPGASRPTPPVAPRPAPVASSPSPASPPAPQPQPQPQPQPRPRPTPVDQVVQVVTSITEQVPAPAGPVATGAVQAAGGAADNLLGPGRGSPTAPGLP